MGFKIPKLTKMDIIAVIALIAFIALMAWPIYFPGDDCEVARPGYKCESAKTVMIEHCAYWGNFSCNSNADVSLPQVEWYIQNLCDIAKTHESIDCSNLKLACNQVSGKQVCSGV